MKINIDRDFALEDLKSYVDLSEGARLKINNNELKANEGFKETKVVELSTNFCRTNGSLYANYKQLLADLNLNNISSVQKFTADSKIRDDYTYGTLLDIVSQIEFDGFWENDSFFKNYFGLDLHDFLDTTNLEGLDDSFRVFKIFSSDGFVLHINFKEKKFFVDTYDMTSPDGSVKNNIGYYLVMEKK